MKTTIHHGDCREILPCLDLVDAVVTDPPYGLKFMGKEWDHGVPGVEFWKEILAAMKPGAHLLAFGGTRTHHRLMVAIEDAGFEIRDCLMWVYGTGFPKSLDVGKAIDKAAGAERETGPVDPARAGRLINQRGDYKTDAGWSAGKRKVTIDPPTTDAAKQWDGWGTALKPAWEPIILARRPLEGTVAANVTKHGTGGLNVDGCRVETDENPSGARRDGKAPVREAGTWANDRRSPETFAEKRPGESKGRWPANLIHDGSEEATELFPETTSRPRPAGIYKVAAGKGIYGDYGTGPLPEAKGSKGSAARFFYCAKASRSERGEGNDHPTVKPQALMRYLCRLVCPPGGVVLDPFMGSGSTLLAARAEGFRTIGIDIEERSCEIARSRLA